MKKAITIGMLLTFGVILILWDIFVAVTAPTGDTISEVTLWFAMRHPVVPFTIGVIGGHLFWPQYVRRKDDA